MAADGRTPGAMGKRGVLCRIVRIQGCHIWLLTVAPPGLRVRSTRYESRNITSGYRWSLLRGCPPRRSPGKRATALASGVDARTVNLEDRELRQSRFPGSGKRRFLREGSGLRREAAVAGGDTRPARHGVSDRSAGSAQIGLAYVSSLRELVRLQQDRIGSDRIGSARLGSARMGSDWNRSVSQASSSTNTSIRPALAAVKSAL